MGQIEKHYFGYYLEILFLKNAKKHIDRQVKVFYILIKIIEQKF